MSEKAPTPEEQNTERESDMRVESGWQDQHLERPAEEAAAVLNTENQSRFERMTDAGKRIASKAYERIYDTPVVNRVVGKLEIAYNQFWLDTHEEKAVGLKEKTDGIAIRTNAIDQSKAEMLSTIKELEEQGLPGAERLQLQLKDLDRRKEKLLNKQDKLQSKFEDRENKVKLYTNERDTVADQLIERYDEQLAPMENKLEQLQEHGERLDASVAAMEQKHEEKRAQLADIEARKQNIEEALGRTGMSERKIRRFEAVKALEDLMAQGRESMRRERASIMREKAKIDKKIAKTDVRANPYRDKRAEFVRVKEGRPIDMDVSTREREESAATREDVRTHTREESAEARQQALERRIEALKKEEEQYRSGEKKPDFQHNWARARGERRRLEMEHAELEDVDNVQAGELPNLDDTVEARVDAPEEQEQQFENLPTIVLPRNKTLEKKLGSKLEEYKKRFQRYQALETQMDTLSKTAVLESLMKDKRADVSAIAEKMAKTYGSGFDVGALRNAASVIEKYIQTGGKDARAATGL